MDVLDLLGRPIKVGDYVVSYNFVYNVIDIPKQPGYFPKLRICLVVKNQTTKPVRRSANELCLVPKKDVLTWLRDKNSTSPIVGSFG